ncbi:DNA mismatch repair protein MutL, partial [Vibrio parahaemolyticus]|nr:glutamate mutase L [Vibrio parahaemolyticus]NMR96739.1 DNA mismatch repair protein MutL [Vibrio parahaemolyticus]
EGIGKEVLAKKLGVSYEILEKLIDNIKPIPENQDEIKLIELLTEYACVTAVKRHAGVLKNLYGPSGKMTFAEGKDLTSVKYIIGTGGALTRLPGRLEILKNIPHNNSGMELLPNPDVQILIDNYYIMASLGVMSYRDPEAALKLLDESLDINMKGE